MSGEVEERVDLGDGHTLRAGGDLEDLVPRLHLAFFEDAEVEPRATVGDEESRDARLVHPETDAVTGDARLSDFEDGGADLVSVADADLVVAQSVDGEVLAELPVDEVVSFELACPVAVGVQLVDEDGALLAAVPRMIALPVAFDVEPAHSTRAVDRIFEDAGVDRLSLPRHVSRHPDVDGDERPRATAGGGRLVERGSFRAHAHTAVRAASSTSSMPPISSTLRLRSGPWGRTFWPGTGSSFSPSIVIVSFSG